MEDAPTLTPEVAESIEVCSRPFVGQWQVLVSDTNWEKGRIIFEWRESLIHADSPATEYSDEAWSRRVGTVTGQHVGRLRRVYHRFGQTHSEFAGLFWSHFYAALDWDDAEMWLEGAVQSKWSVAQMRATRHETVGGETPRAADIVTAEPDEDFAPLSEQNSPDSLGDYEGGPRHDPPDFGDADDPAGREQLDSSTAPEPSSAPPAEPAVAVFENLPDLPDDLADAFDHFKLAILAHKAAGWQETSPADVLATLDALKALAQSAADQPAPF